MRNHNHTIVALVCILLIPISLAWAQTGTITGKVSDAKGNALPGANVRIEGTYYGAASGSNGRYNIKYVPAGSWSVKATFLGYSESSTTVQVSAGATTEANFSLEETTLLGQDVVVTASRRAEKITGAPATMAVLDDKAIRRSAGFVYGEAIANTKGVDFYRTGVDGIGLNARGFMTAFSYRTQVLADNRYSSLPGASVAPGNLLPVAKDDIQQVEFILGPSSALYGPNAHNGLLNVTTKHPRTSQGTTLTLGGGENSTFISRARHAGVLGKKFAYKANFEYLRARDWEKNDPVGLNAQGQVVREDPDFDIQHLRFDGGLYYSFTPATELVVSYGRAETHNIVTTNISRNQVDGWVNNFQQLRLHSPRFFVQFYRTGNGAGNTHNINTKAAFIRAGLSEAEAIKRALFIDESQRYNAEAQYNNTFSGFYTVVGANFEDNLPVSKGTYLSDTGNVDLKIKQFGVYGQVERDLFSNLRAVLAARYDTHDNYDSQFSPRVGLIWKIPGYGGFRVTYNKAYQAPAILQQELLLSGAPAFGFPVTFRGNGHGFTRKDGSSIEPLQPETVNSYEAGYRGLIIKDLFVDVNGYLSKYENFISPLVRVGVPTPFSATLGVQPIITSGGATVPKEEFTFTYVNFGEVTIQGIDFGINYQFTRNLSARINFSTVKVKNLFDKVIDPKTGKEVFKNDADKNGNVEEVAFNAPKRKYNAGITYENLVGRGSYVSLGFRHVDEYDFVSGSHRATKAGKGTGNDPFKDRGPLGGFNSLDLFFGYAFANGIALNVSITNIANEPLREFVGSPEIRRLAVGEVRYSF